MRPLNKAELAIMAIKERRMGRKLLAKEVEYRKAFPRSTICIIDTGANQDKTLNHLEIGVSMRAKNEPDVQGVGEVNAFVRALNAL